MPDKMILSTSDEAARFVSNISGWVARGGRFWGNDEHMARYDGCTHRPCETCGEPVEKISGYMLCEKCREKKNSDRFLALPRREWDKKTPLSLWDGDEFFFSEDELLCWCEENDIEPTEARLVLCEPNYAREIDFDDLYIDDLPDEQSLDDIAPDLAERIKALNQYIRESKIVLSWGAINVVAIIPEDIHA